MKAIACCPGWHRTGHGVSNSGEYIVQTTTLWQPGKTPLHRCLTPTGPRSVAVGNGRAKQFVTELDDLRD